MRKYFSILHSQFSIHAGFTLVEVLTALGIITIVVSAAAGIMLTSLNNVQTTKNRTLATKYAQEGMEAIRELRNKNYSAFGNYTGIYCLNSIPAVLTLPSSSCTTPNVGSFIRTVDIQQSGCEANVSKVTVTVAWSDGKCAAATPYCNKASHSSCLSTINQIQAP